MYKLVSPGNNKPIRTYKDMAGLENALDKLAASATYPYVTILHPSKNIKYRIVFNGGDWEAEPRSPIN